jgi:hypothetical protein
MAASHDRRINFSNIAVCAFVLLFGGRNGAAAFCTHTKPLSSRHHHAVVEPLSSVACSGSWSSSRMCLGRIWSPATTRFLARRRREDYDEYDDEEDDDYYYEDELPRRRRRRDGVDDLGGLDQSRRDTLDVPSSFGRRGGWCLPESVSKALLAGVFVMGIGLGVTVDSAINTNPRDLASRDAIDQAAPNPTLCATMGASAMAFDQRVFVSFNPFNVYVAQADVKPACVLRPANVVPILRDKGLINDAEVRSCKANMNTWAYVGDLQNTPQLSCVYKSEDAQNEFLSDPRLGIGEDYLDDDRTKSIKEGMTGGQKDLLRQKSLLPIPGLD